MCVCAYHNPRAGELQKPGFETSQLLSLRQQINTVMLSAPVHCSNTGGGMLPNIIPHVRTAW